MPCLLAAAWLRDSRLATIDYVIILAYMGGVLGIGALYGRYMRSFGDFFLAGKTLPFWAIGMSIVSSDIGAIDFVSGAGATYRYGIAQANFDWIGSMPALLIGAFLFVPYYWRAGVYTIPEFLGRRYNSAVRIIQAVVWLVFMLAMLAVMLWVTAVMMNTVLGWPTRLAIWVTVFVVGFYMVSGGLAAEVMTDVIQMIVMFVGAAALLVLGMWQVGGWEALITRVGAMGEAYRHHFTLLRPHVDRSPYPWTGIVFGLGIVLSTGYFVGNQAVVQRSLGARSEWDAKAGMLFAGLLKLFIPVLVMIPGLVAVVLYPNLPDPDQAVPSMVRDILPAGIKGLMFAAFFAALMGNADSYLNSFSTVLMSDVVARILLAVRGRSLSDRAGLLLGRIVTAAAILAAGLMAPLIERFETIYEGIQTFFSFFQGPTLALLLLGILWRRTTQWGALAGLLLGVMLTTALNIMGPAVFPSERPFLFISFWSFLFSLAVTVLVSLVTPPEPPEKLRGLVYGEVLRDDAVQAALRVRAESCGT